MQCTACGTPYSPGAAFCARCGMNLSGVPMMPPMMTAIPPNTPHPRTSGMAIAGFVLSFFGGLSILGLIFSAIGLSEISKSNGMVLGKGLAIAGICISCFWLLIFLGVMSGGIRMSHLF